jgi:ParB/RepB/Spo0J family partition protein
MRLAEIPIEKVRTGFGYLKVADAGNGGRRKPPALEDPVTVVERGGFFELVDGFKRLRALKGNGATTVPAVVQDWEPMKAKAMMLALNARRRTLSYYEEAALAADLCREEGLSPSAAARLLGRKESWVSKRVGLFTRLDPQVLEFLKTAAIGPTLAYHLSRLPKELQMPLFLSAREENLTVVEAEAAVSLALSLSPAEAKKVARRPRRHLSPPPPPCPAPRPGFSPGVCAAIDDLEGAIRASRRATEKVRRVPSGLGESENRVMRATIKRARREATLLLEALQKIDPTERRFDHEGPGSHGEDREGHGREKMLHEAHREDAGRPQGHREEIARAFPGKTRPAPAASLQARSLTGEGGGTGPEQAHRGREGSLPDREEHLPHPAQGGVRGEGVSPRILTKEAGFVRLPSWPDRRS